MKIALYGLTVNPDFIDELLNLYRLFQEKQVECIIHRPFAEYLHQEYGLTLKPEPSLFGPEDELPDDVSFILSIGGDGTFLKSFSTSKSGAIPLVGINTGRLGFLSDISRDEIEKALDHILGNDVLIDERSVLELEIVADGKSQFRYGMNEITVTKLDSAAMINIHTFVNEEFLNTYWADGLIIATPTGSTAYSLSVGGPILTPDSENFVISPIAPHNLTVRPLVVPDHHSIMLQVEGRGSQFLASVDSSSEAIDFTSVLKIKKAPFKVKTIRLKDHSFFTTLRNKLMWGADKRN
jgi:NAD+ kinase